MDVQDTIRKLAGTYLKDIVSIYVCTVDSVDKGNRLCDCTPISGDAATSLPNVQLCAENDNGLLVFPTVGSTVIVALSTRNTAFVLMYSGVDGIQMLDGTYMGLVKVIELTAKLNIYETKFNELITAVIAINAAAIALPAVPVTNATLAAFLAPFLVVPLVPTIFTEIENDLITHGKN